ncbi:Leucine-rich repeat-containing protein 23 [Podochytrium sp. JEL0797]|nr:Leucine-rich repeat-containing protein 23 [Podochytrium sp. JEL0797]
MDDDLDQPPIDDASGEIDGDPGALAAAGGEGDDENKVVEDSEVLTSDMIGQNISLLARTGNGLSHAYTRLEIHSKNITNIEILENYLHLRYIDLSENSISDISALYTLEYLLSIDFHANKITRIPAGLDKRKYLQMANFAKNNIESIDVTNWPMMSWLNLNENKLTEVKLPEFEELLHLEARANQITTMKGINSRKLEKLYLAGNQLTSIELEDKPNLQILHLRDNKITTLDGLNESQKSLSYVNLKNNLIETLDDVWKLGSLPNLKSLNLTDNPVQKVPNYRIETIYRCKKLEKLDKEPVTEEEREEAEQLQTQRTELESELKELIDALKTHNTNMTDPLVVDGFPRADIDVYTVRHLRSNIIRKQNDHKALMADIEKEMHNVFQQLQKSGAKPAPPAESAKAFAVVNSVAAGSPAEVAGLCAGDRVVRFGGVEELAAVAGVVSEGAALEVIVMRNEKRERIQLIPNKWDGRGLLGCHLLPL